MSGTVDTGWFPDGWVNPADDPALDWIVAADDDHPDPVPPAERLAEEPGWDVETEDIGQNDDLIRGLQSPEEIPDDHPARKFVQPGFAGLDLRDYSRLPDAKGWGAPCAAAHATVVLSEARVTVDARIAELVGLVMRACEARGYHFRPADTGAYNCRKIAGTTVWSNHAWALAIDVNWQSNPYTTIPNDTDIPDWMHNLWNRYGFAWGGDYTGGKRDFMHFEFMGTPQQAQLALALARAELAGGPPVPAPPPPAPSIPKPPVLAWPLPLGHYFGNVKGPAKCHGGDLRYDSQQVHLFVQNIQEHLMFKVGTPTRDWQHSGWDDGVWTDPTDPVMIRWHQLFYGGQQFPAQCWRDDYNRLVA